MSDDAGKKRFGRPVTYDNEVVRLSWEYLSDDEKINYRNYGHAIPSIVGLSRVINRSRATIYDWAKDKDKCFAEIVKEVSDFQEFSTLNDTLTNKLNAQIGKLVLANHGYSDKQELGVTDRTPPLSAAERRRQIQELLDKCRINPPEKHD